MLKDKLTEFVEELSDRRVHIVKEMYYDRISEGSKVFVNGDWITWLSCKRKRTKCYINGLDSSGVNWDWEVWAVKFLVKI
jgi:hypothetical protein